MRINRMFLRVLPRITTIVLTMLYALGNLNPSLAAGLTFTEKGLPAVAVSLRDESGLVHRPLASVGVTTGQTARINVVNSPDPNNADPPQQLTVEMCFHDSNGNLILDRSRRPIQRTVTIDSHHGDSLDLNGSLVAGPGARVVIIPCVKILRISEGTLAVPTFEIFNNLLKTTFVLNPGIARGFDPQPDPPALPEVAFGLVGITQGVMARLYVLNAEDPTRSDSPQPITVEVEFHDANGDSILDRSRRPVRQILTLNPNQVDFLELNGDDIAAFGSRAGIVPCVKVLRGSPGSLVVPTLEMYISFTQQTLLLSNFVSDPHTPVTPASR